MTIEVERNFLVDELPVTKLQNALLAEIQLGHLIHGFDRKVEIRRIGKLFSLTEKQGASLLTYTGKPDNG